MSSAALIVRRTIRAAPEFLFDAWTKPELLKQWWGPAEVTCPSAEVDLRVGGTFRIANRLPDASILWIHGTFEVIDRPRRLVYTWSMGDDADVSRVTVRFEPRDAATEVVVVHEDVPPVKRDDHEKGWTGCLDGLQEFAASSAR